MTPFKSAFTVDVECGISITMRDLYDIHMKPTERVVRNTSKILELLDQKEIKGTFFTLGIVAEIYPELVKKISSRGHELGVHGYHHYEFNRMSRKEAYQELDSAKKRIEDISGKRVYGHRAPAFSINQSTEWGLDVIYDAGFLYDSSIMPIQSGRYGWPGYEKHIQRIVTPDQNRLIEVPLTSSKLLFWEIPACGGRYFQILPYSYTKKIMQKTIQERPAVLYMHPYEIDEDSYPDYYHEQLRKAGLKKQLLTRLRWMNRNSFYKKLDKVTSEFEFAPIQDILNLEQEAK